MQQALDQLGITGFVQTDDIGVLKGTVKIYLDDGADVPRLSAYLRKGYVFKNSAWEPRSSGRQQSQDPASNKHR